MTNKEKLKEIENWHFLPETIQQVGPQSHFDMNWLINRVEKLTAALEWIKNNSGHSSPCSKLELYICDAGCVASEKAKWALEDGEVEK